MKIRIVYIVLILLLNPLNLFSELKNPRGNEPAEIVKQVMDKYGIEQGELSIRNEGYWAYTSETSAVVAFETTERVLSMLEWGETNSYGSQLNISESHYIHVYYLKDLMKDKDYHIRLTAFNDSHTQEAVSDDFVISTKTLDNAVRIPDDIDGNPPYILDQPDTYYLVTEDITADSSAFEFTGEGSTLDLGGHTIIYNEIPLKIPTDQWTPHREGSSFGIKMRSAGSDMKILNGTIIQGKGNDTSSYVTLGFNPIYVSGGANLEIAGLNIQYAGVQITGIYCHYPGENMNIHHNIVTDSGKYIINRHQQVSAIKMNSPGGGKLYNNLIKRARQSALGGIGIRSEAYNNEIHIESYSINSFGIGAKDTCKVHDNKIFGFGDNVCAIATTGGTTDTEVYNNYIWLQAHDLEDFKPFLNPKDMESTDISTMSAIRITWGGLRINYHDNIIMVVGREGGILRGTWLYSDNNTKDIICSNNLIIALAEDDSTTGWGAIGGVGSSSDTEAPPINFINNTIVSNFTNYSMKDSYGYSMNYLFTENTFVRAGDRDDYVTIRSNEGSSSKGAVFIDSKFEGGAGYNIARMSDYSHDDFTVKWTLTINAPEGTHIRISDSIGNEVHNGYIEADSTEAVILTEYKRTQQLKEFFTPHTIFATFNEESFEEKIYMDDTKEIYLFNGTGIKTGNPATKSGIISLIVNSGIRSVEIEYYNPTNNSGNISIYDISGKYINSINIQCGLGYGKTIWNCKDRSGYSIPSGIYFIVFNDGLYYQVEKIIL
ncbi:hypothetical protein ACFLSQ_09750 [Bacteroidota bacterium]